MGRHRLTALSFLGLILGAFLALGAVVPTGGAARAADVNPPSVPQGMAFSGRTPTTVSLVWRASTDDVGVAGYSLYRNGRRIARVKTLKYTYTGLKCATRYTFALEAYDAAGNASNRAEATGAISTRACLAAAKPKPKPVPAPTPKPVPAAPSTAPSAANLWVDTSGGSCLRRSVRAGWADGQACSWNEAYRAAQTGDLILVRGGNYGDVTLGPNRTAVGAAGVTFRTAAGQQVVIDEFENGSDAGGSRGADNLRLIGPVRSRTFSADRINNLVVDRWHVNCGGCANVQTFHLDSNNVVVRNSDISNNTDAPLMWVSGTNLTFDNNRIHDAGLRAGSGAHTECMYAWDVRNLRLTRNHFFHCAVMDVFITGSAVAQGGYVENNIFERPWEDTGVVSNTALAFHFRNGGDPSPDPNNWDFRHNTFVGPLSITGGENSPGSGGVRLVGNVFLDDAPSCRLANTSWSHNAFTSDACGSKAIIRPLSTFLAGFTTGGGSPGNYALRATSILRDKGDPADYPRRDRTGRSRPVGSGPDIGAYEFR